MLLSLLALLITSFAQDPAQEPKAPPTPTLWLEFSWDGGPPETVRELFLGFGSKPGPGKVIVRTGKTSGKVDLSHIRRIAALWHSKRPPLGEQESRAYTLCDQNGFWGSRALPEPGEGAPLEMEWTHYGTIRCEGEAVCTQIYRGPDKEAEDREVVPSIKLVPTSGAVRWERLRGQKLIRWVKPGRYSVEINSNSTHAFHTFVQVDAGKETFIPYELNKLPGGRTLHGLFEFVEHAPTTTDGWGWWSIDATLRSLQHKNASWSTGYDNLPSCVPYPPKNPMHWETVQGKEQVTFKFYDIPTGPVDFSARCNVLPKDSDVLTRLRFDLDDDLHAFMTVLNEAKGPGWGIQWIDPVPPMRPEPIGFLNRRRPWVIHARPTDPDETVTVKAHGQEALIPNPVAEAPTEWAVVCRGMQPWYGTKKDFEFLVHGFRLARIKPIPGWGTTFAVLDAQRLPIEGAQLFAEGKALGTSDANGEIRINLDAQPEFIRIEKGKVHWTGEPSSKPWQDVVLRETFQDSCDRAGNLETLRSEVGSHP